jgi:ubiquinone/menaquinone biosynthesis C-methylase UbiE
MSNEHLKKILEEIVVKYKIDTNSASVLDVGCADIRPYSSFLISKFYKYEGIDTNQKILNNAQKKIEDEPNATISFGNVEKLNYSDNSIDVVVCNNVLAYTDKKKAVREILRVLKKNGVCISLYNNTIDYSLLKIIKKQTKPMLYEISHSVAVIINTVLWKLTRLKVFHTTFNTKKELKHLLMSRDIMVIFIEKQKIPTGFIPMSVINFMFRKNMYDQ